MKINFANYMKKYVILKLDTPLTLVPSAMRVPQAEPVNFAKALIDAAESGAEGKEGLEAELAMETVDVCMLGHAAKSKAYGRCGTIRTVPYFGDPKSVKDEFADATIIIWQGRHIFNVSMPSTPMQLGAQPTLVNPYSAGDYERLCMVKIWQVQMYNLLASAVIPDVCEKYFIVTDLRLPLIELNKIDPVSVPRPLPKGITLLTQAYQHEAYNAWQSKYGNGLSYPEIDLTDYTYKFAKSAYLPLHALPIWSHCAHAKPISDKLDKSIFQVQSIKYVDDYRKKKLGDALKLVNGNCVLHGRFGAAERGIIVSTYPEYSEELLENCIDNSNAPSESFFDSAETLSKYKYSLIITDQRYARFGLCPNRFAEALAVGTIPIPVKGVFDYCDDTLRDIVNELDTYAPIDRYAGDAVCKVLDIKYAAATEQLRRQLIDCLHHFIFKYE